MGKYLKVEEPEKFLTKEATLISEEDVAKLTWSPKMWLVAQVNDYVHKLAIVCFHERELEFIQRAAEKETRDVSYYIILASKLEGLY